ncbi:MAG: hypothetical protein JWN17_3270 [Frankiales bacterium]|nr:hypothetical protein [Frankiales bacterium]
MRRLLLVLLLLLPVGVAGAQTPEGPQGVGIAPAAGSPYASASGTFLELGTVTPGRAVSGTVLLRNQGTQARTVLLYASDAVPSQGGGFGFTERTAPDTQVGRWLTPDRTRQSVPARGGAEFSFSLTVPVGTQGGEYVGGIVAEPAEAPTGAGVQTLTRVAMAVYLTVPGGARGATPGRGTPNGKVVLTAVRPGHDGGRSCPVVSYRNDSQQVLDPEVEVTSKGLLGSGAYHRDRVGAVLPGTSATVRLPCVDRPLGTSTLRVVLMAPTGPQDYAASDLYLPLALVLALLLLLLLVLAVLTTALRGRRARSNAPGAAGTGQE